MPRFLLFAGVMALLGSVLACGGGDDGSSESAASDDPNTITVKMLDNSFKPDTITVQAGSRVTFVVPNVGVAPHNMHIASDRGVYRESPWISKPDPTNAGQTSKLVWDVSTTLGTYKFRCDYHEVEMVGTIAVE